MSVDIDDTQAVPVRRFSGHHEVSVAPGRVTLELRQWTTCYRWKTIIGLVDFATPETERAILGHAGCLDYFVVTFDGGQHGLVIEPKECFPGTVEGVA